MHLMAKVWDLSPLILHPFLKPEAPPFSGLAPGEEMQQNLLERRFSEMRMHFYVGRDLFRWVGQCAEVVERTPALAGRGLGAQSFASMLARATPAPVVRKLRAWGVPDPGGLFSRAMGLNTVFLEMPERNTLSDAFLLAFECFADDLFTCYLRLTPHAEMVPAEFHFEMYASGEYIRILEEQWG